MNRPVPLRQFYDIPSGEKLIPSVSILLGKVRNVHGHFKNLHELLIATLSRFLNFSIYCNLNSSMCSTLGPRFKPHPNCVSPRELTQLRVSGACTYSSCAAHAFRHKCRNPPLSNDDMFIQIKIFFTTHDRVHKITMQWVICPTCDGPRFMTDSGCVTGFA